MTHPTSSPGTAPDLACAVDPRPESGFVLITVVGEVDLNTAARLTSTLTASVPATGSLIVDLAGVEFFAASGLWCLQSADELLAPPARMHLVCPDAWPVQRVVTLLGLGARWPVHADVADAVAAVAEPAS